MSLATAAVIAAVIVAPWLVVTVGRHGMGVILDVPSNGPHLLTVLTSMLGARSTGSDLVDPLAAVMLAMAILHLVRRRWLLPALWLATSILSIQYGIVFGSMLVGSLAAELWTVATSWLPSSRRVGQAGVVVITLLLVIEGALGVTATQRHGSHLAPISADRREAMGWVADHLPSGATVAVLTGGVWSTDADSEWFYVLAERTSSATVQGSEWLGEGAFDRHQIRYQTLQRCAELDDGCVSAWLERWPAGYLFIPRGRLDGPASPPDCCEAARYALRNSGEFEVIYDDAGATIFRTRYPADARSSA